MSEELAVIDVPRHDLVLNRAPSIVLEEAKAAAVALTRVLKDKADPIVINGKQYLEYEDWQTVGRFYNVTAKVTETEYVTFGEARGFAATAVAVRGTDGMAISAAEAMCLNDEALWKGRDLFQLKSMAQTRACAKVLRNVLAWVVVLGGYGTTPAEEMDGISVKGPASTPVIPPAADSSVLVTAVELRTGTNAKTKKPWTMFLVTFDDGRSGATFDTAIADDAKTALADGRRVIPALVVSGKYINLQGLVFADAAPRTIDVNGDLPITREQQQRFGRTIKTSGRAVADVQAWLLARGIVSTAEIPRGDYDALVSHLEHPGPLPLPARTPGDDDAE